MEASGGVSVFHEHESLRLGTEAVQAAADRVAEGEGVTWAEVNVILGDHRLVHDLNREWLGHDWETDVVSFPLHEDASEGIEGEVYVDLDTAREVAPEHGATFDEEALRYVIHGLLHLVGHDDATDEQRAAMRALEDRYLAV